MTDKIRSFLSGGEDKDSIEALGNFICQECDFQISKGRLNLDSMEITYYCDKCHTTSKAKV